MNPIEEFLSTPHDAQWHINAEKWFGSLLLDRYGSRGASAVVSRAPRLESSKAPYAALLQRDNPPSGGYGGTSFVLFPSEAGSLFGLVVGTQGLAPDEDILCRPGHARMCRALADWTNAQAGALVAWSKAAPTNIETPLPRLIKDRLQQWAPALDRYGSVFYLCVDSAKLDAPVKRRALVALLDLYMGERGCKPLVAKEREAADLRREIVDRVLPPVIEDDVFAELISRRFVILQGPPGTGKTRMAIQLLASKFDNVGHSYQLHPSVGYEQFVGGLAPIQLDGRFGFRPLPGMLMQAIDEAQKIAPAPYLLHLDEINRADLARMLGEALFLFEPPQKDDPAREVRLAHDFGSPWFDRIRLPANLHVLGTMNSADRSTAILDLAVRRRFSFLTMWPDRQALANAPDIAQQAFDGLQQLFVEEASDTALELMPGHSYFLATNDAQARSRFRNELAPLLKSYAQQGLVPELSDNINAYLQWLATV